MWAEILFVWGKNMQCMVILKLNVQIIQNYRKIPNSVRGCYYFFFSNSKVRLLNGSGCYYLFFWSENGNRKKPTHGRFIHWNRCIFGRENGKFSHCIQPIHWSRLLLSQLPHPSFHPILVWYMQPTKWLRLLNKSGRYKFFTLGYPDFAAVKWKRLLNGSGCNSVFYGICISCEINWISN